MTKRKGVARFLGIGLVTLLLAAPAAAETPHRPLTLVETAPMETELDSPDLPEAAHVWREMIDGAQKSIDLAHFYASSRPQSRLEPVIAALTAAGARGVRVRFLVDQKLVATYAETVDRIAAIPGVTLRRFDGSKTMGGILHAKYMIVDGTAAFIGSQNFDWRSLTHVQELGVRLELPAVIQVLADVFARDWALSGGEAAPKPRPTPRFPVEVRQDGELVLVTPVVSPKGHLPDEALWDLPQIIALIDRARDRVRVQLLTYDTTDPQGRYFGELEAALRRAAARRVKVTLIVSHWCTRKFKIDGIKSLHAVPGITVKIATIPPWTGGFVPHSRVVHAKYVVVDGRAAWIGTSNWGYGYFYDSRNVGLIIDGGTIAGRLEKFFLDLWDSPYAEEVDLCRRYRPPRVD